MAAMRAARRRSVLLIVLIAVSLPIIGAIQYRWLGELSALEQLRARTTLETASRQFSTEFDALLAHAYDAAFHAGQPRDDIDAVALDVHRAVTAAAPRELVRRVHLVQRLPSGQLSARAIDDDTAAPAPAATWPAWLHRPGDDDEDLHPRPSGLARSLLDDVPALVVPLHGPGFERWAILELDRDFIVRTLMPAVLAGGFHDEPEIHHDILITREDVPADIVYTSRPGLSPEGFDDWVSQMPLFALHSRDMSAPAAASLMPDAAGHRWRLFLRPQGPDIEAALRAVRRRNLGLGLGTLALLAISVTTLVVSANRMQRAAHEQLEVVARISHELRTPLASIRCAGDNLADSLVTSPEDTRAYGEMIRTAGQRLTRTLQDILLCCRLQARPETVLQIEPLDVAPIIEAAVADSRLVAGEGSPAVATSIEPGLPPAMADREALGMVLRNLVINAVRHGGGAAVTVSARSRRTASGREVVISVRDEGRGIPDDELPHLFEPFFRGRDARNHQVEGTGIGLSLVREAVESQGGRVRVASAPGAGTTFTVHIPIARPGSRPA